MATIKREGLIEIKNETWDHKIGGTLHGFIPSLILLIVFLTVSILLYNSNNNAYIFSAIFSVIGLVLVIISIYRFLFVKVLIGKNGFFHQTGPGNGKYYEYTEISEAFNSSGMSNNGINNYFFTYKTTDGRIVKFSYMQFETDEVYHLLSRINGKTDEEEDI